MTAATITLLSSYGTATAGAKVILTPAVSVLDDNGGSIPNAPTVGVVAPDGTLTVAVVAPDAPGITPQGWSYEVSERFPGGSTYIISPTLTDGTTQHLGDLKPLAAPSAGVVQLRGRPGPTPALSATVTNLDPDADPTVTVTGDASTPTMNLGLPDAIGFVAEQGAQQAASLGAHTSSDTPHPAFDWLRHTMAPAMPGSWNSPLLADTVQNNTPVLNSVYLALCFAPTAITIDNFDQNIQGVTAGALSRCGVYFLDPTTPDPTAVRGLTPALYDLVVDYGTVAAATAGRKLWTPGTPLAVPAGTWFGIAGSLEGATTTVKTGIGSGYSPFGRVGGANGTINSPIVVAAVQTRAGAGALPSTIALTPAKMTGAFDLGIGYHIIDPG